MVAGRLAASGDFRAIRALMTDRPHTHHDPFERRPAAGHGADGRPGGLRRRARRRPALSVQTAQLAAFRRLIAGASRTAGVRLLEVVPADESLESVFDYLVRR